MEFLDLRLIYLLLHVFGAVIGAGAALTSDWLFFTCLQDKKFSRDEINILKTTSKTTWLGLILLIISGVGLFTMNVEYLIDSSKFLAKMTIVAIILINGIIFHTKHLKRIDKRAGRTFFTKKSSKKERNYLFVSGVVSVVSWVFTVMLGVLNSLPFNYWLIMAVYFASLVIASLVAIKEAKKFGAGPEEKALIKSIVIISIALVITFTTSMVINYQKSGELRIFEPTVVEREEASTNYQEQITKQEVGKRDLRAYTMTDIAEHDNGFDCWVVIDNMVFDLTSYYFDHPVPYSCGEDVTDSYFGQHGPRIKPEMESLKKGFLVPETN